MKHAWHPRSRWHAHPFAWRPVVIRDVFYWFEFPPFERRGTYISPIGAISPGFWIWEFRK